MGRTTGREELNMKSINSKNIFDVVKEKYAPDQPKKNHKIDPIYSLFDRNDPLPKCQDWLFLLILLSVPDAKPAK